MSASPRSARQVAIDWANAWNGSDASLLADLFTADGTYVDLAVAKTSHGRSEIAGFKAFSDALIADLTIEVRNAFGDGEHVAVESIYSGHLSGAPRAFAVQGTTILRLEGDLIATDSDNYNLSALLRQSGLPSDWAPAS